VEKQVRAKPDLRNELSCPPCYDVAINNYDDLSVKGEVAELKAYQEIDLKRS